MSCCIQASGFLLLSIPSNIYEIYIFFHLFRKIECLVVGLCTSIITDLFSDWKLCSLNGEKISPTFARHFRQHVSMETNILCNIDVQSRRRRNGDNHNVQIVIKSDFQWTCNCFICIWHNQGKWVTCRKCQIPIFFNIFLTISKCFILMHTYFNWISGYRVMKNFSTLNTI